MTPQLKFRDGFWQRVAWSRPDSPPPVICSRCFGPLPEIPLALCRDDGSAVAFCDTCIEQWITSEVT